MCTRPAARCEIDHSTEYDHHDPAAGGPTTADNLQPLCKAHHRLKTAGGWIDARLPDGRILWTSPTGRLLIVDPAGTVLGLFPDLRRIDWTTPPSRTPKVQYRNGPTRLEREHARRADARAASIALLNDLEPHEADTPQSEFERSLEIAILAFTHTRRDESRRNESRRNTEPPTRFPDVAPHPRPPGRPHPDDEPPPF
ncbi:HNH endonuclease [Tsukamurella ocularis]|uniref:HNH endonuclease signature motif containing protein n=1 Tax=Tsukamurella ocularis TaxID=1970234 RepID=UPI0039EFA868